VAGSTLLINERISENDYKDNDEKREEQKKLDLDTNLCNHPSGNGIRLGKFLEIKCFRK